MSETEKRWHGARERRLDPGRRSLTASEAASIIGVSVATVRGWADRGRLPSHRTIGGHRRFELDELRGWLAERGAPVPGRLHAALGRLELPRCPRLARELATRVDAITDRVVAGYHGQVPTVIPRRPLSELRGNCARFVRVVSDALHSGNPDAVAGRAEISGMRGGLQGTEEVVLAEHMRLAGAVLQEADELLGNGVVDEPLSLSALHAVLEHAQVALVRGIGLAAPEEPSQSG